MEFSMGGVGTPPSVQIIDFLKQQIIPLQTVLYGLKHEKINYLDGWGGTNPAHGKFHDFLVFLLNLSLMDIALSI